MNALKNLGMKLCSMYVHGLDSEFTKVFQQNLQNLDPQKALYYILNNTCRPNDHPNVFKLPDPS